MPWVFKDVVYPNSGSSGRRTWRVLSKELEVAIRTRLPMSDAKRPAVWIASFGVSISEASNLSSRYTLQI